MDETPNRAGLLLPTEASFAIKREGRRASWHYTESHADHVLVARTVAMLRPQLESEPGLTIDDSIPGTVIIRGETDFSVAANAVVGEFLMWSDLAAVTFGELLGLAIRARAERAAFEAQIRATLSGVG